ncbi:MAG: fibronectin type III domain-containing protein [Planctomycetota bacterium]|nr:fibronectin type III domain-containing protein [Planctomycetota bacterium]
MLAGACGKKGNPLPPLQRVPAAPPDFAATRIEADVWLRVTVPNTNVDGAAPSDIARVELYGLTADRRPVIGDGTTLEDLRVLSTLIASEQVRRPLPPPPPPKEGFPPIPGPPPGPGVDQGSVVVVRETLAADAHKVVALKEPELPRSVAASDVDVPRPLVAPAAGAGPQRYYYAVGVSARGRYGPPTQFAPIPLGVTSSAPPRPELTVTETTMTLRWEPAADARGAAEPSDPAWLASRSIVPGPPPTMYDVYEVPRNAPANAPLAAPAPLTPEPSGAREITQPNIALGTERCFQVRPVDIVDGIHVRGPASPTVCADFADEFPPSPPGNLDAVAVPGAISLIWEPSIAKDIAGYLVLRGEAGSATLTPLMTAPISELSYRDDTVRAGIRYTFAIVAVDKSGNRSTESNRIDETARQ